ncbi:MAG: biotin synthase BioB [bacterium]|nr:biotin synthase BioB [bacterium]
MDQVYTSFVKQSLDGKTLDRELCENILVSSDIELLPLLTAAFQVRNKYWGRKVTVHVINNVQNGGCLENCTYCAQSCESKTEINTYPMKEEKKILEGARVASESGAFRYCMVFSGTGSSKKRIDNLVEIIKKIKKLYNLEVCVSPGFIDRQDAEKLKKAGLNRLNHNLNTSENYYPHICTSHNFQDRVDTIMAARSSGLEVCSGLIAGMGEGPSDIVDAAFKLHELKISSIPVNFFMPIEGLRLNGKFELTPDYCLRVLCLFRFLNPEAEIRVAAGREMHLRTMQTLSLYPANSLFMDGYLNTTGNNSVQTLQMIKDAGFIIESDKIIDEILDNSNKIPGAVEE